MAIKKATIPLIKNEYVIQLLSILQEHNKTAEQDIIALLDQVASMEKQLELAVQELTAIRQDFAAAKKQNQSVKNALQKAVIVMQDQVTKLRNRMAELKQRVIDGCKNAISTFKEKGIIMIDNTAQFFKVVPILEAIQKNADRAAGLADKAATDLERIAAKYHEAGRRVKNAGRALSGKDTVQEAKPNGKIAKTFTTPFRATYSCFKGIQNNAVAAVGKFKRLEQHAAKQQKPSIKKAMKEYNRQILNKEQRISERDCPNSIKSNISL